MMKNDLISIAMATYNGEKYLRLQLDSIISQTHQNFEVIICDDCSTDDTTAILREYAKRDKRIKIFCNTENLGLVKNFEKALSFCSGEYIALADQDDIWLPEKLEVLLSKIGINDLICSSYTIIDENDQKIDIPISTWRKWRMKLSASKVPHFSFDTILYHGFVTGCTSLFKASLLKHALPIPKEVFYHDWWLSTLALKYGHIVYLSTPLILYRQHTNNHTGIRDWSKQDYASIQLPRLSALYNSPLFYDDEKNAIQEALLFYSDQLNTKVHLKALFLAIKNHKHIWPNSSFASKLKSIAKMLFTNRM
jgi:glycosyltransferase involved in cell wall biosynthesis